MKRKERYPPEGVSEDEKVAFFLMIGGSGAFGVFTDFRNDGFAADKPILQLGWGLQIVFTPDGKKVL